MKRHTGKLSFSLIGGSCRTPDGCDKARPSGAKYGRFRWSWRATLRRGHLLREFCKNLIVLCLPLLATSCIKLNETLTINKDASCTLDVDYVVSEDAVTQAKAAFKLREQMTQESVKTDSAIPDNRLEEVLLNPSEDDIRREIGKYARFGLALDKLKVESKANWRHVALRLSCKKLTDVAKADFFAKNGFSLTRNASGNYVFLRDSMNKTGDTNVMTPDAVRVLSPILAGFNVVLNVSVPGKILKTTAQKEASNTATWSFDFDADPNALTKLQSQQFTIVFEGKGLKLPLISQK